jgi:cytochrome c-type biogenesis protein CcmE
MRAGVKTFIAAFVVVSAIGYLAFRGATTSWKYYLSVDEAVADAGHLEGDRVRIGGRVAAGTLTIADDRRHARFDLVSDSHTLRAVCRCGLPDNLSENIDVVVEGKFENGCIVGNKVITRCASKYKQKEIASSSYAAVDRVSFSANPSTAKR